MNKADQVIFKEIVETHSRAVSKMPLGAEKPKMQAYFEWLIATLAKEADEAVTAREIMKHIGIAVADISKEKNTDVQRGMIEILKEQTDRFLLAVLAEPILGKQRTMVQPAHASTNFENGEARVNERGDPVPASWKKLGIIQ